jgi:GT2 family glycosyltransferase
MSSSVHVVIVNWNTGRYLKECLASLVSADRDGVEIARVTVVDNASSDGSADGIESLQLPLEVIRNGRNAGFAAACNQGAAGSTADYLLFMNPDTRLYPDTLAKVTAFMDGDRATRFGICGAQIVDADGRPGISCARFPTLRILTGKMTGLDRVLPQLFPSHHLTAAETARSGPVDQVIGAFFFVRRELFELLGGFDERYFIYFEEVDFALRACWQGSRSYFLEEARVFHQANVSTREALAARIYHSLRSRLLYARRHWPRRHATALLVLTLTVEPAARLARAALRASGSEAAATLVAYGRLIRDLPLSEAPSPARGRSGG